MASPDTTAQQQPYRFRKGQSGNPAGRPRGARHRTTVLAEKMMAADAEAVVRAVIDKAIAGDMMAARLVVERLVPPRRDRLVKFALPALDTAEDIARASRALMLQVAAAEITPLEAGDVMKLFEGLSRTIEVAELAGRVAALEEGDLDGSS